MKKNKAFIGLAIGFLYLFIKLLLIESSNPWLFGRYSLVDFVSLILVLGVGVYVVVLRVYLGNKFLYVLFASFILAFGLALTVELGGQVYASFFPSYRTLAFIPDPVLGWKFVPNFEFIHTGSSWYAKEFSTKVKINSQGFRDLERKEKKEKDVFRIAVLGDSMVAARQVDFSKTATQLLEKKLNAELGEATGKKFEVLNFGVGAFGVSQYYLTWQNYASKFQPDIVFAYIFEYSFFRSINLTRCSEDFKTSGSSCLSIRPVFTTTIKFPHFVNPKKSKELDDLYLNKDFSKYFGRLPGEGLFFIYPKDYKKFVQAQDQLINSEFNGKRIILKQRNWFLQDLLTRLQLGLNKVQEKLDPIMIQKFYLKEEEKFSGKSESYPAWLPVNHVNFRLLGVLGQEVKAKGAQFVIVDSFKFHSPSSKDIDNSSEFLNQISEYYGFSHLPFYKKLNDSAKQGNPPRWKYDGHLNQKGNQIFADEMYDTIINNFFQAVSVTP